MLFIHEHDPQFLHRDLTAKNVLMNKDGCVMNISDRPWSDKFRPSSVLHLTTKAPRCIRYMLPECLVDGPHFTDKEMCSPLVWWHCKSVPRSLPRLVYEALVAEGGGALGSCSGQTTCLTTLCSHSSFSACRTIQLNSSSAQE